MKPAVLILAVLGCFNALGQTCPQNQNVALLGSPINICAGVNTFCYYDDVYTYNSMQWSVSGGSVQSQSGNSATINFTSSGTITVQLYNNSSLVTTLNYTSSVRTPGTISSNFSTVCPSVQFTLSTSGGSGDITWESRPTGGSWSTLGTSTAPSGIYASITQNTEFRAFGCTGSYSNAIMVNLYGSTTAGSLSGGGSYCTSGNPGTLQEATAATGGSLAFQWQLSTDGSNWSDISGATSQTYAPGTLTATKYFRRKVTGCVGSAVYSNTLTVTVYPSSQGGTASVNLATVCVSGSVTLSLTGQVGTINAWYYRYSDNGGSTWSSYQSSGSGNIAVSSGSTNRQYSFYAEVQSGVCSSANSSSASTLVYANAPGIVSPATIEAIGVSSGTLALGSYVGTILKWQKLVSGSWQDISTTDYSIPYNNQTLSTAYKVLVQNASCTATYSAQATITITPAPAITADLDAIPYAGKTTLHASGSWSSRTWYKNDQVISGQTGADLEVSEPADYKLKVTQGSLEYTTGVYKIMTPFTVTQAVNGPLVGGFEVNGTTTILKEGVTENTSLYTLLPSDLVQSIAFIDGLGRPYQSIAVGQSPQSKDIIKPVSYASNGAVMKDYLPYVVDNRLGVAHHRALKGSSGSYSNSEQRTFYQNAAAIAHDTVPYAQKTLSATMIGNVREQGAPGSSWRIGGGHTVKYDMILNTASQVRIWKPDGTTSAYYAANKLAVGQVTDENGNKVRTFTDILGRTLLKQVQLDGTIDSQSVPWLETYYIYNEYAQLIYQIPPKALAVLAAGSQTDVKHSSVTELIYSYKYDGRGRLTEKKVPGAAVQYYVYDKYDRLTLSQDGNLRASNKWVFIKYDGKDRAIMTGLVTDATHTSVSSMQTYIDGLFGTNAVFEEKGSTAHGYTNVSYPDATAGTTEVLSVNYYDNHDFDFSGTDDYGYTAQGLTGEGTQATATGLPTGGKKKILGTSTWLLTYVFYDTWGRPIQVLSNNHLSSAVDNLSTSVHDFSGKVLLTKTYVNAGGTNQTTVVMRNTYDHAGRLRRIYHRTNTEVERLVSEYVYNEIGQLIEKKLHCTNCGDMGLGQPNTIAGGTLTRSSYSSSEQNLLATQSITLSNGYYTGANPLSARIISPTATDPVSGGATFLQSVDMRYNIRGWVNAINNSQLSSDGTLNDDTGDYFGMEILYDKVDSIGNSAYYNGNIGAMKWKTFGQVAGILGQRSYKYSYDKSDKLTQATFQAHSPTAWNKEVNTLNEGLGYDHNGNIQTLSRNSANPVGSSQVMDGLTYTYTSNQNALLKVTDAATASGFNNGTSGTSNDYTYDTSGNIKSDLNKGISNFTYNEQGKVSRIDFTDNHYLTYAYDAGGSKLTVKNYNTSGQLTTTTDYLGGFVYTNGSLSFFSSPEGRVIVNGDSFEYQYAIADHQGNTRVVFSSVAPPPLSLTATFEDNTQTQEQNNFQNYPSGGNRSSLDLFDHTDNGTTYTRSYLLNGGYNSQVGLAKSLHVYPGDSVKMEAMAKYWNSEGGTSNLSGFAAALLSAFGLSAPGGGEVGTPASGVNSWGSLVAAGSGESNTGFPKAFVNMLIFDKNYNLLDLGFDGINGGHQVGASPDVAHDTLKAGYLIKEEGYVYFYISNENPNQIDVYFDDIKVTHKKSNLIQANEYYPFGLQTAGGWTRENMMGNSFLGNGGTELNGTSNLYDLNYRNYDAVLGRMGQVDPMADSYANQTPYNFGFNDPVYWNDPGGANPLYSELERYMWGAPVVGGQIKDYYNATSSTGYQCFFMPGWKPGANSLQRRNSFFDSNATFVTPLGDEVSASEVLAVRNPNQNPIWRMMAMAAILESRQQQAQKVIGDGYGSNWNERISNPELWKDLGLFFLEEKEMANYPRVLRTEMPFIATLLTPGGAIGNYAKLAQLTKGWRGLIQAHHIVEARHLKVLGLSTSAGPAVIVSKAKHLEITNTLRGLLLYGSTYSKAEVMAAYRQAYSAFPEWIKAAATYLGL